MKIGEPCLGLLDCCPIGSAFAQPSLKALLK